MSTQENPIPHDLAHLLIELSQDVDKRDQFQKDPLPFLVNRAFHAHQIDALRSRDPQAVRAAFRLNTGNAGLDMHEDFIRDIVRDEIEKAKKPAKKKKPVPKKKKVPAKKKK